MPPRYAYWTILVDNQPTAFRSAMQEDLMPTFKRLKQKHPSAEMKWFQNGKLWNSRVDAQEAMFVRGERGRAGDRRQGGFRDRGRSSPRRDPGEKLEWKPKGEFTPAPKRADRPERLEWKPKGSDSQSKLEWKPRGEPPRPGRGAEARRDKTWRPGGEHKDPRQKYKDAKKAKWTRFKKTVRTRWESKKKKS